MNMKKLQSLVKQAQAMQERLESEMNELRFEGESGGGLVKVVVDGKKNVESVSIDPKIVDPEEIELLQDLIAKAFTQAAEKVDEKLSSHVSGLTSGLLG